VNRRAKITVGILSGVVVGMLGLAYAAEPLYKAFCAVTGFGGTTQVATERPKEILDRTVRVYFDANVEQGAPLSFRPTQPYVDVRLGETMMASFELTNTSDQPVRAMASKNVVPHKVGTYFEKIECFCFEEQTYQPGQKVTLPVVFFVSPEMAKNHQADDVQGITLSYTYYRATGPKPAARLEDASAIN
jgi:cytochrome c oxidase assembly protein subunit 11